MRRALTISALLLVFAADGAAQPAVTPDFRREMLLVGPNPSVAAADRAWRSRHERSSGARARPDRILEAIAGYERAAKSSEEVEARWKLTRALFFRAKYTGLDRKSRLDLHDRARRAGEEAIALLRRRAAASGELPEGSAEPSRIAAALAKERDGAPTYFWTAAEWGEWALLAGRAAAARAGAAAKIRDYAEVVIALDPEFEEGGGYRILGRLHHKAPRIPLVTGWVSRAEALRNLRLAVRTAPRNFVNRHFLAEALADGGAPDRAEAVRIERALVADSPNPAHRVEDVAIQEEARKNLAAWRAS